MGEIRIHGSCIGTFDGSAIRVRGTCIGTYDSGGYVRVHGSCVGTVNQDGNVYEDSTCIGTVDGVGNICIHGRPEKQAERRDECGGVELSTENHCPCFLAEFAEASKRCQGERRCFYAAARAAWRCADYHQDHSHYQRRAVQAAVIDRAESRSSCGHAREKPRPELLARAELVERAARLEPFEQPEADHSRHEQNRRCDEHEPGVERELSELVGRDFVDDEKPDAAEDYERREHENDVRIRAEALQAVGIQAESGVVERADRVEERAENPLRNAVPRDEHREKQDEPRGLDRENGFDDQLEQIPHTAKVRRAQALLERQEVAETHPPAEREENQARGGHIPEPADLDEQDQHPVAEVREVGRCVHDDEAGHADRARGRENHVDQAPPLPRRLRNGEDEKNRADQDHGEVA